MIKDVAESRLFGIAIVAIGVVLVVLGLSVLNSGGAGEVAVRDGFPSMRDYSIIGGCVLILGGGIITLISAKKYKNVSSRNNPGPTPSEQ